MIVALLGAECTGKSTLAEALASRFGAGLVSEYLREWCDTHGRTPQQHEQAHIAAEQASRLESALSAPDLVICDTTPLLVAVCSQHYFGDDTLLDDALAYQRHVELTLLCAPDLPWQADGFMRDGPEVRAAIDARLRTTMSVHGVHWMDISGSDDERLAAAVAAFQRASSR